MWLYQNSPDQLKSGFLDIFHLNDERGENMASQKVISMLLTEKNL